MSFEVAIRITELMMGLAFAQQSVEHLRAYRDEWIIFLPRLILAVLLVAGIATNWVLLALLLLGIIVFYRFDGPYNGGADRMSMLILICLVLENFLPSQYWREIAFGYLAIQLILSYFISGWVKIINPEWRSGQALSDVFLFSAYPVSEALRRWSTSTRFLLTMSWAVIIFELIFPLSILSPITLKIALVVAATFHLSNAFLFGLNRFFWIWLAAYPSIIWFQQRVFVTIQ